GLGLTGAVASVAKGALQVGSGGGVDTLGYSLFDIINVPWNDGGPGTGTPAPPYKLRANRAGYTIGPQRVDDATAGGGGGQAGPPPVDPSAFDGGTPEVTVAKISVPPMTSNYTFVTDWGAIDFEDLGTTLTELDSYLFMPTNSGPSQIGCSVGFDDVTHFGGD